MKLLHCAQDIHKLHTLTLIKLTLQGRFYYPRFTKETKTQRQSDVCIVMGSERQSQDLNRVCSIPKPSESGKADTGQGTPAFVPFSPPPPTSGSTSHAQCSPPSVPGAPSLFPSFPAPWAAAGLPSPSCPPVSQAHHHQRGEGSICCLFLNRPTALISGGSQSSACSDIQGSE